MRSRISPVRRRVPLAFAISLAVLGALTASTAWSAGSGVIEINQARAIVGGVGSFDPFGFPVTIDQPGSYVLTSDLVVPDANTSGILITAENVSVDLAGFSIRGPGTCSAGSCSTSGSGIGIESQAAYTTVRNGHVRGFGSSGLALGNSATVYDVAASNNSKNGFLTGLFAKLRDVRAENNGTNGIRLGSSSQLKDAQSFANGEMGVYGDTNLLLHRVQAAANGYLGVYGEDLSISDSSVSGNSSTGIFVRKTGIVRNTLVVGNTGSGIGGGDSPEPGNGTSVVITGNVVRRNEIAGISVANEAVIRGNVVSDNDIEGIGCWSSLADPAGCLVTHNVAVRNLRGLYAGGETAFGDNVLNENGANVSPHLGVAPQEIENNMCDSGLGCP